MIMKSAVSSSFFFSFLFFLYGVWRCKLLLYYRKTSVSVALWCEFCHLECQMRITLGGSAVSLAICVTFVESAQAF